MTRGWSLVNSYGVVLFYLAANPDSTMREVSTSLNLTERRVATIIHDLVDADLLRAERQGRRNTYSVNRDASFRHPFLSHIKLGDFEALLRSETAAATVSSA